MEIYNDKYGTIHNGDCLEVMKAMPDNSIDTLITDPPAGINFMGKAWDHNKGGRRQWVEYMADRFREAKRIVKPGGIALVWALPKTSHWTACALEDAGWEIDTKFYHLFGSGFPKSLDVSKGIDKRFGAVREKIDDPNKLKNTPRKIDHLFNAHVNDGLIDPIPVTELAKKWNGWKTQIKPACEEWICARNPVDKNFVNNALVHGVAGYNIDGCRIEIDVDNERDFSKEPRCQDLDYSTKGAFFDSKNEHQTYSKSIQEMFQKGRYPGNVIIDDYVAEEIDSRYGDKIHASGEKSEGKFYKGSDYFNINSVSRTGFRHGDTGGPSRFFTRAEMDFFYGGKAPAGEKNEGVSDFHENHEGRYFKRTREGKPLKNNHPTVKSLALMRWLCRLSRPPGEPYESTVIDMFSGTMSTAIAAHMEGRKFICIEQDLEYCNIGIVRLKEAMKQGCLW